MPKLLTITDSYNIAAAGGTKSYDLAENIDTYFVTSSPAATLLADMNFTTTGTPYKGLTFYITYLGGVTSDTAGGKTVNFFGVDLTDEEALTQLRIVAVYDGSAWSVGKFPYNIFYQKSLNGYQIKDGTMGANSFPDGKIPLAKLVDFSAEGYMIRGGAAGVSEEFDAGTAGQLVMGTGGAVASVAMSGDVTITGGGVTAIGNNKVVTAMILADNVTVEKVESDLKYESRDLLVSFEAAAGVVPSVGDFKIQMAYPGSVVGIYAYAVKAIAGTDNGTIVPKNNAGTTMTAGTITFTAADVRGTAYTSTPSANNTFVTNDFLTFTTAKVTAGGLVQLSIKILRS